MSSIPSHGPPDQGALFDFSRNETSYGNFTNMGQHASVINNHVKTNFQSTRPSPLGVVAPGSSVNEYFDQ